MCIYAAIAEDWTHSCQRWKSQSSMTSDGPFLTHWQWQMYEYFVFDFWFRFSFFCNFEKMKYVWHISHGLLRLFGFFLPRSNGGNTFYSEWFPLKICYAWIGDCITLLGYLIFHGKLSNDLIDNSLSSLPLYPFVQEGRSVCMMM